jgi:ATP-dependent Lon protease
VILPAENEPDLEELPPEVREAMRFVLADTMDDVLEAAFEGSPARGRAYRRRNELPSAAQAGSSAPAG